MQSLLIINAFQKVTDLFSGIRKVLVFTQVYLLIFERLHKTVRFGIIIWIALTLRLGFYWGHTDGNATVFEQTCVLARSILNAPIRMMHLRPSPFQSHLQCTSRQSCIQASTQRPAQAATGTGIEDHRQKLRLFHNSGIQKSSLLRHEPGCYLSRRRYGL